MPARQVGLVGDRVKRGFIGEIADVSHVDVEVNPPDEGGRQRQDGRRSCALLPCHHFEWME
jgi:hypothetical protein